MKPLIFFTFCMLLSFSGTAKPPDLDQRIQVNIKEKTLTQVLDQLTASHDLRFAYSNDLADQEKTLTLQMDAPLKEVLQKILEPFYLEYVVSGELIVIRKIQGTFTVSGYIKEMGSGELLSGAIIYEPATGKGTYSNFYGFYSLSLAPGVHDLLIAYVGYAKLALKLDLSANRELEIRIIPNALLAQVTVNAQKEDGFLQTEKNGGIGIDVSKMATLPAFFGEKDVIKSIQLLPGVSNGADANAGINVRGGDIDQNLLLIDDALLYNSHHFLGFFSVLNATAIKSADLSRSAISARYGGRLSSVLEVKTREGNKEKLHGEAGIGLISSKISLEGPLFNKKTSFFVSARRTYIDYLAKPFMDNGTSAAYYFFDVNAKANHEFSPKSKLYLSAYTGADYIETKEKGEGYEQFVNLDWSSKLFSARWNYQWNTKTFSNLTAAYSDYKVAFNTDLVIGEKLRTQYRSGTQDVNLKYDVTFVPNPRHYVRYGISGTLHYFNPQRFSAFGALSRNENLELQAKQGALYIEDELKLGSKLDVQLGLRVSAFHNEKSFVRPEPRVSFQYKLPAEVQLRASYARMTQYIYMYSNSSLNISSYFWLPVGGDNLPQTSDNFTLAFSRKLPWNIQVNAEVYYRRLENVFFGGNSGGFLNNILPLGAGTNVQLERVQGKGKNYGAEVMLSKNTTTWTHLLSYTHAYALLQFDNLNQGEYFYAPNDRRNQLTYAVTCKLSGRWRVGAAFVYASGAPFTLPTSQLIAYTDPSINFDPGSSGYYAFIQDQYQLSYSRKVSNYRLPAYHRMDINAAYSRTYKKISTVLEAGIYNVYNKRNPFLTDVNVDGNNGRMSLVQQSLFPLLPYVSYNVTF